MRIGDRRGDVTELLIVGFGDPGVWRENQIRGVTEDLLWVVDTVLSWRENRRQFGTEFDSHMLSEPIGIAVRRAVFFGDRDGNDAQRGDRVFGAAPEDNHTFWG
ncbi:hypothetical protein DCC26_04325 [Auritidibacter sp. NML120779]|nr:hypothetical protein DCC26_04325 [Auritidibacter sp. NML120779]